MAKLSPFMTKPEQWVEELAGLKADRKKIEDREEKLKTRILAFLKEKGIESLAGEKHEVRLEKRESTDFSQGALKELFGEEWLADAKRRLPARVSESLRMVEIKKDEPEKPATATATTDPKVKQILDHFAPGAEQPKPAEKKPWSKKAQ